MSGPNGTILPRTVDDQDDLENWVDHSVTAPHRRAIHAQEPVESIRYFSQTFSDTVAHTTDVQFKPAKWVLIVSCSGGGGVLLVSQQGGTDFTIYAAVAPQKYTFRGYNQKLTLIGDSKTFYITGVAQSDGEDAL